MSIELTKAEELAIELLKKASMKKGEKGEHVIMPLGGVDPDFILDEVNIESDGGDW